MTRLGLIATLASLASLSSVASATETTQILRPSHNASVMISVSKRGWFGRKQMSLMDPTTLAKRGRVYEKMKVSEGRLIGRRKDAQFSEWDVLDHQGNVVGERYPHPLGWFGGKDKVIMNRQAP
jgi:hypothetical protein